MCRFESTHKSYNMSGTIAKHTVCWYVEKQKKKYKKSLLPLPSSIWIVYSCLRLFIVLYLIIKLIFPWNVSDSIWHSQRNPEQLFTSTNHLGIDYGQTKLILIGSTSTRHFGINYVFHVTTKHLINILSIRCFHSLCPFSISVRNVIYIVR